MALEKIDSVGDRVRIKVTTASGKKVYYSKRGKIDYSSRKAVLHLLSRFKPFVMGYTETGLYGPMSFLGDADPVIDMTIEAASLSLDPEATIGYVGSDD